MGKDTELASRDLKVISFEERRPLMSSSHNQMRIYAYHTLAQWFHNHPEVASKTNIQLNDIAHDENQDDGLRDKAAAALLIRQIWLRVLKDPSPEYPQGKQFDMSRLTDGEVLFFYVNSKGLSFEDKFARLVVQRGIQLSFDSLDPPVPTDLPAKISYEAEPLPL